ncbi:MAG TPA: OmpA family protein [Gammaproteobacteria bacterium]|nr:OmpA family protein [Gammaproteobacteria bacterium]
MIRFPVLSRVILAAALVATAGCTTMNPYTGEQQTSNTAKGATIGAIAGAVLGLASGGNATERRQRALIGAGIGALSGGAVGHYMDQQEAELRRRLQGTGVSVTRQGQNVILNMPGNVTFATDSAALNANFFDVLNSVAIVLKHYDKTLVHVAGFTDSTGSAQYNLRLSQQRAEAVAKYLESQGVSTARLIVRGYGEQYPVASNKTAQGRQQNRRVEVTLAPITQNG